MEIGRADNTRGLVYETDAVPLARTSNLTIPT
jgi:hypothetical protein